jgi:hypothetical protein
MSIIEPRKNRRKPNVATVSFILSSPRTVTKTVRIKELPNGQSAQRIQQRVNAT